MKKLLLLLLFPFFTDAQVLDVVEKGYYFVWVNDTIASQHSKPNKAMAKMLELKLRYPDYPVFITQPNVEPDIEVEDLVYMVNYNYNYSKKGVTLYAGKDIEVSDVVLSDYDQFDVKVTDKYMNLIVECKQNEIVNVPNIEAYEHFFVRYTSEPFADLVYKLKVVDGKLINALR